MKFCDLVLRNSDDLHNRNKCIAETKNDGFDSFDVRVSTILVI